MMHDPTSQPSEGPPLALLYQQVAPKILNHLRKQLSSIEEAEDLLVDVFVAALESHQFANLTEQEQQAWLWRVARNQVVNVYRQRQRHPHLPLLTVEAAVDDSAATNPELVSTQQEEEAYLHALIKQLSPLQQTVLRLRFSDELRCAFIASTIRKREGTVRSILSRTLNQLRRLYEQR